MVRNVPSVLPNFEKILITIKAIGYLHTYNFVQILQFAIVVKVKFWTNCFIWKKVLTKTEY